VTASLAPLFAVLMLLAVPTSAQAALEVGPLEIGMYGRMGVAWNPQSGQFVHGRSLNLLGNTLGGRLEEGDYLEPNIKLHIVRPTADDNTKPYFHFVITPSMFSAGGSFLGAFANNFSTNLRIELFQAYLEAGNVLIPDLKIWAGQRFYRGSDVHIADYYYFNQLNSQGFGVKYKGVDMAVLLQTSSNQGLYAVDVDGNPATQGPLAQRQRTVFVAQYAMPVGDRQSLSLLAEFHLLPAVRNSIGGEAIARADNGQVLGAKYRWDLGNGSFNEASLRVGRGIANGAFGGGASWSTFGGVSENGTYDSAAGIELVDHVLVNVNPLVTLNAYAIFQLSSGASGRSDDVASNFNLGLRSFFYVHDQLHLIGEVTRQTVYPGLGQGEALPGTPTAYKFTLMPTLVPSGERSAWARPHLRLIYTLAVYNEAARRAAIENSFVASPYHRAFGPREFGHYLGARAEWWF
jgi:maltoporin